MNQQTGFRPDVQGLRALAVLLVLAFHADIKWFQGGFLGVDVFFVVSGFVIGRNLFREIDTTGTVNLRKFYSRRIRRILPPLAFFLTVVAGGSLLFQSPLGAVGRTVKTSLATSAFGSNLRFSFENTSYFDAATTTNPLLHMWSLSVEEQFYFVVPALLLGGLWISRKSKKSARRVLIPLLVFLAIGSLSIALAMTESSWFSSIRRAPTLAFYGAPFRAWEFAAGLLLAALDDRVARIPRRVANVMAPLSIGALAWGSHIFDNLTRWPGRYTLVPVVATAAAIAAGRKSNGPATRLLSSAPARWVGDISYPLYLWHYPLVVFAANLWPTTPHVKLYATFFAVLPAWLSDRFLETPIRTGRRLRSTVLVFGLCIAVPVSAALVSNASAAALRSTSTFTQRAVATQNHADVERRCDESLGNWDRARCTWPALNVSRGDLVLVGDSEAGALSEAAIETGKALDLNVVIRTHSECPFMNLPVQKYAAPFKSCTDHNMNTLAMLNDVPPKVLVVSFSGGALSTKHSYERPDGHVITDRKEKSLAVAKSLSAVAEALNTSGTLVVFVEPVMDFPIGHSIDCPTIVVFSSDAPCGATISKQRYDDHAARIRAMLADVGSDVHIASPDKLLCDKRTCRTVIGSTLLMRDAIHLTTAGSRLFAPILKDAIEAAK